MKDKFQTLQPWLSQILYSIKKEIKTEHLSKSPAFYKAHFGNRPLNRLTNEEICAVYEKQLLQGDHEDLSEWVVNRWVFRHGDIYQHFADRLAKINPDFDAIKNLDEAQSKQVLSGATETFGALPIYLFTVLNGVVFPKNIIEELRSLAEKQEAQLEEECAALELKENIEQMKTRYHSELSRMEKKYEDKLTGVMKKHVTDVEALKKQIRSLQQQLNSK